MTEIETKRSTTIPPLFNNNPLDEGIRHGIGEPEELLYYRPGIIIEWSSTIFFIVLLILAIVGWFIPYPETVRTQARLTSNNAPKPIYARADERIIKLFHPEGAFVQAGQDIGYLESNAQHEQVMELSLLMEKWITSFTKDGSPAVLPSNRFIDLGELQEPFQAFTEALLQYNMYLHDGFYSRKRALLKAALDNLRQLEGNIIQEEALRREDLRLSEETYAASAALHQEKVISAYDYRAENSKLLSKKLLLPQANSALISNRNLQVEKEKELLELSTAAEHQRQLYKQAMHTLMGRIAAWKRKYLLVAPVQGRLQLSRFSQENTQVHTGDIVAYVSQDSSDIYAVLLLPQYNLGKVKIGQRVILKFYSYPAEEYGYVEGRIDFISPIPSDSGYQARITLPSKLTTNSNVNLPVIEGLMANADIISKDMNIWQRLYYTTLGWAEK